MDHVVNYMKGKLAQSRRTHSLRSVFGALHDTWEHGRAIKRWSRRHVERSGHAIASECFAHWRSAIHTRVSVERDARHTTRLVNRMEEKWLKVRAASARRAFKRWVSVTETSEETEVRLMLETRLERMLRGVEELEIVQRELEVQMRDTRDVAHQAGITLSAFAGESEEDFLRRAAASATVRAVDAAVSASRFARIRAEEADEFRIAALRAAVEAAAKASAVTVTACAAAETAAHSAERWALRVLASQPKVYNAALASGLDGTLARWRRTIEEGYASLERGAKVFGMSPPPRLCAGVYGAGAATTTTITAEQKIDEGRVVGESDRGGVRSGVIAASPTRRRNSSRSPRSLPKSPRSPAASRVAHTSPWDDRTVIFNS